VCADSLRQANAGTGDLKRERLGAEQIGNEREIGIEQKRGNENRGVKFRASNSNAKFASGKRVEVIHGWDVRSRDEEGSYSSRVSGANNHREDGVRHEYSLCNPHPRPRNTRMRKHKCESSACTLAGDACRFRWDSRFASIGREMPKGQKKGLTNVDERRRTRTSMASRREHEQEEIAAKAGRRVVEREVDETAR
jgi:hypothetical protein